MYSHNGKYSMLLCLKLLCNTVSRLLAFYCCINSKISLHPPSALSAFIYMYIVFYFHSSNFNQFHFCDDRVHRKLTWSRLLALIFDNYQHYKHKCAYIQKSNLIIKILCIKFRYIHIFIKTWRKVMLKIMSY